MNSVDEQANRLTETLGKAFLSHRITLDDCRRIVAEVLKTTRQEALREAASKLGIGDSSGLLDAPCLWCGYNGRGYYQVGTHDKSCIWHTVGGRNERLDRLANEGG